VLFFALSTSARERRGVSEREVKFFLLNRNNADEMRCNILEKMPPCYWVGRAGKRKT